MSFNNSSCIQIFQCSYLGLSGGWGRFVSWCFTESFTKFSKVIRS